MLSTSLTQGTHIHTENSQTLSVMIPDNKAFESVNKTASTRRAAIRRHASETDVPSDIVRALDNLSFLTVLSPPSELNHFINNHNYTKQLTMI